MIPSRLRCVHTCTLALAALFCTATCALAHFGAVIPSTDIVTQKDPKTIEVAVKFLHPMEGDTMEMAKPEKFGVLRDGAVTDLLATLQPQKDAQGHTFWTTKYQIKGPGDYTFFVAPTPYWEPAEDHYIQHFTKVCVDALDLEAGWDKPVGLPMEIIPLTRPYGLWTGNVFTGQVLVAGKPAPGVRVEIEHLNTPPKIVAPAGPFVTQVVKTDANGVFTYAMPRAGWWGFSALTTAEKTIKHDGADKEVEQGAVYWVHTRNM